MPERRDTRKDMKEGITTRHVSGNGHARDGKVVTLKGELNRAMKERDCLKEAEAIFFCMKVQIVWQSGRSS